MRRGLLTLLIVFSISIFFVLHVEKKEENNSIDAELSKTFET